MATEGTPKARRVIVVPSAGARILGGPSQPVKLLPANTPTDGGPPIRIALVSDGRAKMGGPAWAVVQITGSVGIGGDVIPCHAT